ncbi:MAG: hypothetical protein WAP47_08655 [Candidatus Rokuibacteriota bacterium]
MRIDDRAIGSAFRTLAVYEDNKTSPLWRKSAIEACKQERLAYMTLGDAYAVMLVDAVINLVQSYTYGVAAKSLARELIRLNPMFQED